MPSRDWTQAEAAVQNDPELLTRVRLARLPLKYVWLTRWDDFRKQATEADFNWPIADSKETVAREFVDFTKGQPDKPWTVITRLNEAGLTPDKFTAKMLTNR